MNINRRIELLANLGEWMKLEDADWQQAWERATHKNAWFTVAQVRLAADNIARNFLNEADLRTWVEKYPSPSQVRTIGIVMAGNIPLVGFHDFLCGFISGHKLRIKLSSKDEVLLPYLVRKLAEWEPEVLEQVSFAEQLKNCDAYIATGSNNTSRYFEQYFSKYPHIIRRNRTSVAVLDGTETDEELQALAADVFLYYGLGCRNVTQVCVPDGYDFTILLNAFRSYEDLVNQHKYKNNYDYHLAIYLLNRVPYMTNEVVLLVENELPFSAVSVLHYRYYNDRQTLIGSLQQSTDIQVLVGHGLTPFGQAQSPMLSDYADGVDVMRFLTAL